MAIEEALKKLTEAVEANTAAILKAAGKPAAAAANKPKAESAEPAKATEASDDDAGDEVKAKRAKIKKLSIELVAVMGTDEAAAWIKEKKLPPPGKIGADKLDKAISLLEGQIKKEKAKQAEAEGDGEEAEGEGW